MIIWSGFGLVVPVIFFLGALFFQPTTDAIFGDRYFAENAWPKVIASIGIGAVLWFVGSWMNKPRGRVFVDKETGAEFQSRPNHSLFFVPVQYWSFVSIALGLFLAFSSPKEKPVVVPSVDLEGSSVIPAPGIPQ